MKTTNDIIGTWSRTERIRNIRIEEKYLFYNNGIGRLIIADNCDGYEEHIFNYLVADDRIYMIDENETVKVESRTLTIENDCLTITENGVVKQYIKEK